MRNLPDPRLSRFAKTSSKMSGCSQAEIEGALDLLLQAPPGVLQTVRSRVLSTIATLHGKFKIMEDAIADLFATFETVSRAIEELAKNEVYNLVDFAPSEADIRFSHINAIQ